MRKLLATLILFSTLVEFVRSDENIYGPSGVNLGPNGDPEQLEQQRQQQEQLKHRLREQQEKAIDEYNNSSSGLTLQRQYNGHYSVNGAINDIPLVFVIDTGASFVTLPEEVASKTGITCGNEAIVETVNGKAKGCMGIIANLKFGDFSITDVQCVIVPNLNFVLLGNNVLERFKIIIQNNGEMRITK